MYSCMECGRKTVGVTAINPETGKPEYLPNLCTRCLYKLSDEINGEAERKPEFTCGRCKAPAWSLRNKECWDCFEGRVEACEQLPAFLDPMMAPLGYSSYHFDEIQAEMMVERDYNSTPYKGDKEN